MTRAGEKLHGEWERRVAQQARPVRWWPLLRAAVLVVLIIGVGGSALFGFG